MNAKRSWNCLMALALSLTMLVPAQAAYAKEGQAVESVMEDYTDGRAADADGFEIEDGVLKKYTGTDAEVIIPEGVTSIGENAFLGCESLKSVIISKEVENIGICSFGMCGNLASIKVEEGNGVYDSRGDCNAVIETKNNTLIIGCKNTIIPKGVANIGDCAF